MPLTRFFGSTGLMICSITASSICLCDQARRVLRRQHHGLDRLGLAAGAVPHRDLRLGVRAQPGEAAVAAHFGLALDQAVREVDRHRHQARRLVAGVAEHQALVAGALVEVEALAFVDALRDVARLLAVGDDHGAAVGVEADLRIGVADALDGLARDVLEVDLRVGRDLAGEHHQVVLHQRLGGDARARVLG